MELKAFKSAFNELEDLGDGDEKIRKKKRYGGGRLEKNEETGEWNDTSTQARDFSTLIRNVILVKLTRHLGLNARLLLSFSGKKIFIVIFADEADLKTEAERDDYSLQLEVGITDLPSLEPCDDKLRPFRLLNKEEHLQRKS